MNYFKTHKIIALFLAVLMILPLIPAVDLTVFAVGSGDDINMESNIGKTVKFSGSYPIPVSNEKPINISNPNNSDYTQLGYYDFLPYVETNTSNKNINSISTDDIQKAMSKFTLVIDDWYYNDVYDLLWYKVRVIEGPAIKTLTENPWIFYDNVRSYGVVSYY